MKRFIAVFFIVLLLACSALIPSAFAAEMKQTEVISFKVPMKDAVENNVILADADPIDESAAVRTDDGEIAEDGINTKVATVWIIICCSVVFAAIIAVVIVLAKKNKNTK